MTRVRLGAFQFDVRRGDVEGNLRRVESGLREAADRGLELVLLPEMWPTSFVDLDELETRWLPETVAALERVRELSRELDLLVGGSAFAAHPAGGAPTNRFVLHDRGEELLRYDKVHLFSPTAETESFQGGLEPPATVATRVGSVSACVCYDLRFASLLRVPFLEEAELILVPAQWPTPRAPHWRALVLGRAVECQAIVLACNRTGTDVVGRRRLELDFPGNSFLVGPHGDVLAEGRGQEGLVEAVADLSDVRRLRRRVPVRKDDRDSLYREWGPGRDRGSGTGSASP